MKREVAATLDAAMRKARIQASVLIQARRRGLSAQRFYRTVKKAVPRIQVAPKRNYNGDYRPLAGAKQPDDSQKNCGGGEYREKSEAVAALQEWIRSVLARQLVRLWQSQAVQETPGGD
ncbi:hypothetical protein AK812_SmicGene14909 [Symbiodinium microadriaticum]|uniref:Uncharacterized protein n=1 Tax=Symbiodinium microadriaticum TaxID=2951 RepID=A0A1Q9E494_SYMMI|nr:hypothetical protein AK812_SmicGene14909 [Symbiodinium microadriaticum]